MDLVCTRLPLHTACLTLPSSSTTTKSPLCHTSVSTAVITALYHRLLQLLLTWLFQKYGMLSLATLDKRSCLKL